MVAASDSCRVVGQQTVVFLDPGHGANVTPKAAASGASRGIVSGESSNGQEDKDVFAVAKKVKKELKKAGYKVVMSRTSNPDRGKAALWQKGNAAQVANAGRPADIGISIHTDAASSVGAGQVYYNKLGGYRQNNTNSIRRTFTAKGTAATSKQYAKVFKKVRSRFQKAPVTITAGHFFPKSRNLGSHGDIPIVMLAAPGVPWVYNEFGRSRPGGLTAAEIDQYARSLVRSTKSAIGPTAGTGRVVRECP